MSNLKHIEETRKLLEGHVFEYTHTALKIYLKQGDYIPIRDVKSICSMLKQYFNIDCPKMTTANVKFKSLLIKKFPLEGLVELDKQLQGINKFLTCDLVNNTELNLVPEEERDLEHVGKLTEDTTTADIAAFDTPAMRIKRVNNFNPWGTAQNIKDNLNEAMNSGLIIRTNQTSKVGQILDQMGYYYESIGDLELFLPEEEGMYDSLEMELENSISKIDPNIQYSIEGVWEDERHNDDESEYAIYGDKDFEEDSFNREQGLIESLNEGPLDDGYEAAKRGKGLSDCPYPLGSAERADWFDGYESGTDEEIEQKHYEPLAKEMGLIEAFGHDDFDMQIQPEELTSSSEDQGYEAAQAGEPIDSCPYSKGSREYQGWVSGWEVAGSVGVVDVESKQSPLTKKVSKFLDKVRVKFYDDGNPLELKVGNTKIEVGMEELENGDESIFLNDIFTEPEHQGKGEAKKTLKEITDYADKNDLPISLRASSEGHYKVKGLSQEDLIKWYEKNGFKLSPDASKFGRDEIFMVREPKPKAVEQSLKETPQSKVVATKEEVGGVGVGGDVDLGNNTIIGYFELVSSSINESAVSSGNLVEDILRTGWEIWYHSEELASWSGFHNSKSDVLKAIAYNLLKVKPGMSFWQVVKQLRKLNVETFKKFLRAIKIVVLSTSMDVTFRELGKLGINIKPKVEYATQSELKNMPNSVDYNASLRENKKQMKNNSWLNEVKKAKVLIEGSYSKFIMDNGPQIKKLISKLGVLTKKINSKEFQQLLFSLSDSEYEKIGDSLFKRVSQIYDKEVVEFFAKKIFNGEPIEVDDLVNLAFENERKTGTEPEMVIECGNEILVAATKITELKESFNVYKDKFFLKKHDILESKVDDGPNFNFLVETDSHGKQIVSIDKKKFISFVKENCDIQNFKKNGIFEYKEYVKARTLPFMKTILETFIKESESSQKKK